ncbi:hypothetical protein LOK74_23275 [Brevibacillus humidisoli]|uniref:CLC_0170 family protein n=1 Tax=Brevibacillus humidisoli TaxID=2895522 RepID=UPI001E3EAF9B|nr:CLC_0170 family protein [Brevibacillus humidisoli]UFJ40874.1 hypothetical protein LOK74_23275 [Brevibacillus humidisoli]
MPNIGFVYYAVFLFLLTGWLLLRYDQKLYQMANMNRERKAARLAGWLNIWLAVASSAANWLFQRFFQ